MSRNTAYAAGRVAAIEEGCGIVLGETHPVECGKVDAFGVRQYCHRCNARLYTARQALERSNTGGEGDDR